MNVSGQTFLHEAARSVLTEVLSRSQKEVLIEALSRSQKQVKKLEDANMRLQRDSKGTIDSIDILLTTD